MMRGETAGGGGLSTPLLALRLRIALVALLTVVLGYVFRSQQLDDALIYAKYIRNALLGQGLVFNPGEHVNALTSPLYAYAVLAGAWVAHGHVLVATAGLSGVFLFVGGGVAGGA